ncbi:DUF1203 domain-containing protein [Streptomyces albidochromogenes]|uniref:DUF1203 domain-containing protein n=1 Tax=Streptomyces albidochromogenes TaxID=329524 RepID=A0ABW6FV88_9ACTN
MTTHPFLAVPPGTLRQLRAVDDAGRACVPYADGEGGAPLRRGGPQPADGYPFARPGALRTVRRYDAGGRIVGGRLLQIPDDATAAFDAAFADPEVAVAHVRAVEYGCFLFEVRRP